MHESTISRVTTNKYVETPQGLFELKYFFHSGIASGDGEMVSSVSVKKMIQDHLATEDAAKPLSDQEVAQLLKGRGLTIARRTVAKYREELGILPSHQRRLLPRKVSRARPRAVSFVVITGLSGAGKSYAIKCFEDMGFFCVDNLPTTLIPTFADLVARSARPGSRVALGVDVGRASTSRTCSRRSTSSRPAAIESRCSSWRRARRRSCADTTKHGVAIRSATRIAACWTPFAPSARRWPTSGRSPTGSSTPPGLPCISSRRGWPSCTWSPPPGWVWPPRSSPSGSSTAFPSTPISCSTCAFCPIRTSWTSCGRSTDGTSVCAGFVVEQEATVGFMARLRSLLEFLLPSYQREGKAYLTVAIGCTGGRHRSVALVEELRRVLGELGFEATVTHRDLERE